MGGDRKKPRRKATARPAILKALAETDRAGDPWVFAIDLQRATRIRWGLLYRALWSLHDDGLIDHRIHPWSGRTAYAIAPQEMPCPDTASPKADHTDEPKPKSEPANPSAGSAVAPSTKTSSSHTPGRSPSTTSSPSSSAAHRTTGAT